LTRQVATSEIREVNIGFNRMAEQLAKIEQDRAVMLAGISHDLRTPLAQACGSETEMSVADEEARRAHGGRHRAARRHHRQVPRIRPSRAWRR
jgi:two-component system osmolarity sensor histidine kinase EnvZ